MFFVFVFRNNVTGVAVNCECNSTYDDVMAAIRILLLLLLTYKTSSAFIAVHHQRRRSVTFTCCCAERSCSDQTSLLTLHLAIPSLFFR